MNNARKPFFKIHVEVGNTCNLQCTFCPEVKRNKQIMDVDTFRSIVTQIAPLTEQVCLHLMGEPLLYPHLEEIVNICSAHHLPIFLVTNGLLLREKQQQILLNPIFRQICFSLHSFTDNFPTKDPEQYLLRIFHFTEMAFQERPELYINYRLWNLQDPQHHSELNNAMLHSIMQRFGGDLSTITTIDITQKKSVRVCNRLYIHFDTEFVWPSLDLPTIHKKGTCYGLRNHFGILTDGTVVPCCLDKEGVISLGNVHDDSVQNILNNPRSLAIKQGFQQYKLVEELCTKCPYIERFPTK